MRKKIFWSIFFVGILIALLTAVGNAFLFRNVVDTMAKDDIKHIGLILQQQLEERIVLNQDVEDLKVEMRDIRVTLISDLGVVLYDTRVDYRSLESHVDREEFIEAVEGGVGEAKRFSNTLGQTTYYYALKLSNSVVVRVSRDANSFIGILLDYSPVFAFALFFILLFSLYLSSKFTDFIIKPMEEIVTIKSDQWRKPYQELLPYYRIIQDQETVIRNQFSEIKSEQEKITGMMNHMREGFIILDLDLRILRINEAAIVLLGTRQDQYTHRHVLTLTRNQQFLDLLLFVSKEEHSSQIIVMDERAIGCFASQVQSKGVLNGIMVFLLDVSEQQKAENIRREFTSNVSHELKTPLTSISGFAELIHSDMVVTMEDAKYFARKIQGEVHRLSDLVSDILRLSQIEEAQTREFELLNLHEIIVECTSQLQLVAMKHKIQLHDQTSDVMIEGNRLYLQELVYNLIDNAIRYNHVGGEVTILSSVADNRLSLRVSDTGIGIPQKLRSRIFERFFTVEGSRSKLYGGTGLGLSIVKHIVEYHRGEIILESQEGIGSEFIVLLPMTQDNK